MMDSTYNIPANETPEQAAMRRNRRIAEVLAGRPDVMPQNLGQGLAAIGDALVERQAKQNAAFPVAPGAAKPDWATNFRNLFTRGNNGGLY